MAEADDLLKDALEANRARELLFRREVNAISNAAALLVNALGGGRTLYVVGAGELALIGRSVAQAFVSGEAGAPLRAIPLASEVAHGAAASVEHPIVREVRAFVDRGDTLLAFTRDAQPSPIVLALDAARSKGAGTIVVCGYPGEGLIPHADAIIVVPSRRGTVIAETSLAIGHSLSRLVSRRLGIDAPQQPKDPFESHKAHESDTERASSDEVVVAELIAPSGTGNVASGTGAVGASSAPKRHITSSVELVPLYVDDPKAAAAAPPPNTTRFKCTSCGESITVDAKFAGRSGQCPQCLNDFVIPKSGAPDGASAPPATAPSGVAAVPASPSASSVGSNVGGAVRRVVQNPAASSAARRGPAPAGAPGPKPDGPVSNEERRRARRVSVKDALLCFAKGGFPDDETQPAARHALDDLSLTGLSFTAKGMKNGPPAKVGDALFVLLDFPAFVDKIKVQGEVRRVEPLPDRTGYAVGVRFSRFLDDAQAKVRRLVENDALRGVRRR